VKTLDTSVSVLPSVDVPSQKKQTPKIREACFDDYAQIAELQTNNGLTTRPFADWAALWALNPVFRAPKYDCPIGWVLEADDGKLVGSIGSIPLAYSFRGRELYAAAACSWAVDASYRGSSLLLLDEFTRQTGVDLVLSTSVSPNSEPALKAFQWSKVPVGAWDTAAFWITNYRGFAKSVLNMKSVPQAAAISYPVSAALYWLNKLTKAGSPSHVPTSGIDACAEFDDRFDKFWIELKRQNPNTLLAVRDRETLSWHYRHSQKNQGIWILTASKGSRLAAYAVFERQDSFTSALTRVRLVDFQALNGSQDVLRSALAWMLNTCREQGIHILETVGGWVERPGMPRLPAPEHRTLHSSIYYYKANGTELSKTLEDPTFWSPTSFDGDAGL